MKDALTKLREEDGRLAELRNIIVGLTSPKTPEEFEIDPWFIAM